MQLGLFTPQVLEDATRLAAEIFHQDNEAQPSPSNGTWEIHFIDGRCYRVIVERAIMDDSWDDVRDPYFQKIKDGEI